ncbi:MAG TPA: sulfite dehydrogenase, partial [Nitrospira sp.]|nr:sulfite dehydrogenase [Nitrospira sp.]
VGVTAAGLITPALLPAEEGASPAPTHVPGRGPSPYGLRAEGETVQRLTTATHSLTPHQSLHGIITPSALHFERHHNGVPSINP